MRLQLPRYCEQALVQGLALSPILIASNSLSSAVLLLVMFLLLAMVCSLAQSAVRFVFPAHQRLLVQLLLLSSVTAILLQLLQALSVPLAQSNALWVSMLAMNSLLLVHLETQARRQPWRQAMTAALLPVLALLMLLAPLSTVRWLLGSELPGMSQALLPLAQYPAGALLLLAMLMALAQWLMRRTHGRHTDTHDESA